VYSSRRKKDFLREKSSLWAGSGEVSGWQPGCFSRTGMIFFFFFEVQLGVCLGNWVGGGLPFF